MHDGTQAKAWIPSEYSIYLFRVMGSRRMPRKVLLIRCSRLSFGMPLRYVMWEVMAVGLPVLVYYFAGSGGWGC